MSEEEEEGSATAAETAILPVGGRRRSLTDEQEAICQTCLPPVLANNHHHHHHQHQQHKKGQLVRITAGAGAGKTTCLLALGAEAARKGHKHIVYVTFTRAAARDGKQRMQEYFHQTTATTATNMAAAATDATTNAAAATAAAAAARNEDTNVTIQAMTLHSCAFQVVKNHYQRFADDDDDADSVNEEAQNYLESKLWKTEKLTKWVSSELDGAIEEFLAECYQEIEKGHTNNDKSNNKSSSLIQKKRARRKVEELIMKTLQKQFCDKKCSLEEFENRDNKQRTYYLAQIFHAGEKNGGSAEPLGVKFGFKGDFYQRKETAHWYADQACRIWKRIVQEGIRTFDIEMKRAQLLELAMPGSILLVDEAQDMTECQVAWVNKQIEFGTHVYLVGDAAQSIYSFRGARSRYLMDMIPDKDQRLTASFRFGCDIAAIANCVLFAKHKSRQSVEKWLFPVREYRPKYWIPYRITVGVESLASQVTTDSLLTTWRTVKPVALIARTNAKLFKEIVQLLTTQIKDELLNSMTEEANVVTQSTLADMGDGADASNSAGNDEVSESEEISDLEDEEPVVEQDIAKLAARTTSNIAEEPYPSGLPKIHIHSGATSGRSGFKTAFEKVERLVELYVVRPHGKLKLPKKLFPEFEGAFVTWDEFMSDCENFEYNTYNVPIGIILTFKEETMEAVATFQKYVMGYTFSPEEADIILSTCHSAKGMEWDNVQVCDDFGSLRHFDKDGVVYTKFSPGVRMKHEGKHWQFSFKEYDDNINLMYVACTRAKKKLSIPPGIFTLFQDFDVIHDWITQNEGNTLAAVFKSNVRLHGGTNLDKLEAPSFHKDLVLPLRMEHGLTENQKLYDAFIRNVEEQAETVPSTAAATPNSSSERAAAPTRLVSPHRQGKRKRSSSKSSKGRTSNAKQKKTKHTHTLERYGFVKKETITTEARSGGGAQVVTPSLSGAAAAAQATQRMAPSNLFATGTGGEQREKASPTRSSPQASRRQLFPSLSEHKSLSETSRNSNETSHQAQDEELANKNRKEGSSQDDHDRKE